MNMLIWASIWGTIGGLAAWRMGLPGGAVVGALLGSGMYNVFAPSRAVVPIPFELSAQIAAGVLIGFSFNRGLLQNGFSILMWGFIAAGTYVALGFVLAVIASRLGYLSFATALFGFSPGGITGISLIAGAEGADASAVSLIHFVRVVFLFIVVPLLFRFIGGR